MNRAAATPPTWQFARSYGHGGFVYRWRCGADECIGRAVTDDFGNLVLVS